MKKEYIILILLIIGLGAYLGLKKDNRIHYELPVPAAVDTQKTDRLEITKDKLTIVFSKTENGWTLTDKNFPAAPSAIDSMLDTVKNLNLSALVSEASDLVRYELDPPNAVRVRVFEGKDEKLNFSIGKTAPSFNHTFVMLANDKRIFQADKSFRNNFDKAADDFRDKLILESDARKIQKLTLEKGGKTINLIPGKPVDKAASEEKKAGTAVVWQYEDGTKADQAAASDLLSSLSRLECQAFLNEKDAGALKKETALCKITLENDGELSLNLFQQEGKEDMAGIVSSSPYAFSLASYKAKDIVSYVNTLVGLEQTEESGPGQE